MGAWPAPRHADDRTRGRERDEEHRRDAQQHEQQIAQPQIAAVLALGAHEVARRGKLDARADAAAQRWMSSGTAAAARAARASENIERREEAHGGAAVRHGAWRAANARRSGTPNGASVITSS